jgi:O-acetyl-ADP-ribose deacetylase (regulator of RNase III)
MNGDKIGLAAAAIFLAICLVTFWWASRHDSAGYRHSVLVFTWLCAALAATLVIFSLFPSSEASGDVLGFTLGGAGAFVLLVWTAAIRASSGAVRRDSLDRQLLDRDQRIAELEAAMKRAIRQPQPLVATEYHRYEVRYTNSRRRITIVTGSMRQVMCAQVWVNSENTDMSMSEADHNSISGLIRYEGGRKSELGHLEDDVIGKELALKVEGRSPVPLGAAVVTGSGDLQRRGVLSIVHAAAVTGRAGEGYRQVPDLGRCFTNVLAAVDNNGTPLGESVLFPLLGTGNGHGDVEQTTRAFLGSVSSYLVDRPTTAIHEVYLLAYTDIEFEACKKVFADSDRVSPSKQSTRIATRRHPRTKE